MRKESDFMGLNLHVLAQWCASRMNGRAEKKIWIDIKTSNGGNPPFILDWTAMVFTCTVNNKGEGWPELHHHLEVNFTSRNTALII